MNQLAPLHHLPSELHLLISTFLSYSDQVSFGSSCKSYYWNFVLHYFRVFKIGSASSFFESYAEEEDVRERFHQAVKFPNRQIEIIREENSNRLYPSYFPFKAIKSLNCPINEFNELFSQKLEKIQTLNLHTHFYRLPKYPLSFLREDGYQIEHLSITYQNYQIPLHLPPYPANLRSLYLEGNFANLANDTISSLRHLHTLTFSDIETLTDVSFLGNIPQLILQKCSNLVDITPLINNQQITISYCRGIIDYRNTLTNAKIIWLNGLSSNVLIDIQHFQKVEDLKLTYQGSNNIFNNNSVLPKRLKRYESLNVNFPFFSFASLTELSIQLTSSITNIRLFSGIPILNLSQCDQIQSLEGLGYDKDLTKNLRNRKVQLIQMNNIEDFSPLNTIPIVYIKSCYHFQKLEEVKNVKDLTLLDCPLFQEITTEMFCDKLTLPGRRDNFNFHSLFHVKELELVDWRLEPLKYSCLNGIETLENLQRIAIPHTWEEGTSEGWRSLKEDYFRFDNSSHQIYIKKEVKE